MEIRLRVRPVPLGDDDVALQALRPRRRRRDGARGDPIGPIGEHRERALSAELAQGAEHLAARLSRLHSPLPCRGRGRERPQRLRNLPRRLVAQLMTGPAPARLQDPEPLGLTGHVGRRAVAVGSRRRLCELALVRHADQGEPVAGGVVLRRRARIRCDQRGQVEPLPRGGLHLRRVYQPIAAHPHGVARLGKVGQQKATVIIGDHDPDEPGRQVAGLRDDPHSRFRPVGAADDSADVVLVDPDRLGGEIVSGQGYGESDRNDADARDALGPHASLSFTCTHVTIGPPHEASPLTSVRCEVLTRIPSR